MRSPPGSRASCPGRRDSPDRDRERVRRSPNSRRPPYRNRCRTPFAPICACQADRAPVGIPPWLVLNSLVLHALPRAEESVSLILEFRARAKTGLTWRRLNHQDGPPFRGRQPSNQTSLLARRKLFAWMISRNLSSDERSPPFASG